MRLYFSTALFQWITTGIVLWRCRARGLSYEDLALALPRPTLAIVVAALLTALIVFNQLFSLRHLTAQTREAQSILFHLALKVFPQDPVERLPFAGLVLSVAFCEEVIYRGFIQRAFENWSGGLVVAGLVGSALLFGIAHLYQGRRGLVSTAMIGLIFSTVRSVTGSLLPLMVAHFVADLMAGFLAPSRVRALIASENNSPLTT
jgi:membrane protease YdiL (CAAX protease family)